MKIYINCLFIILLSTSINSYAQDEIHKIDGEKIIADIEIIGEQSVEYREFNNPSGPKYYLNKNKIKYIVLENGVIKNFEITSPIKNLTKDQLKDSIVYIFNNHVYDRKTYDHRYKANFEGDFLKLILVKKSGKEVKTPITLDLSTVSEFQKISFRTKNLAFINLITNTTTSTNVKFVLRVNSPENAILLSELLKDFNSIMNM